MKTPPALREIERVVDRTIADKERAAKLKMVLHEQYERTRPGNRAKTKVFSEPSDDIEAFWDNVPL